MNQRGVVQSFRGLRDFIDVARGGRWRRAAAQRTWPPTMAESKRGDPEGAKSENSTPTCSTCCDNSRLLKGFSHKPLPPRTTKNKCSALIFEWFTPLARLGMMRPLELADLWHVPEFNKCRVVTEQLDKHFQRQLAKDSKQPFLIALLHARVCDQWWCALYKVVGEGVLYALPMLGQLLLRYIEDPTGYEIWYPYIVCGGMFAVNLFHLLLFNGYTDLTSRVGMQRRVAAQGLLFRKALRVDLSVSKVGRITNLISNDCMKLQLGSAFVNNLYWQPMSALICMVLLYDVVGISALVGLAIMLVLVPLQAVIGKCLKNIRQRSLKLTDNRVGVAHELILSIRLVKILAWEKPTSVRMHALRKLELKQLLRSLLVNSINFLLLDISPVVVAVATLGVYAVIEDSSVDASTVFTALSLLNLLRKPLQLFPRVLMTTLDGWVALKRIERFLKLPEVTRSETTEAEREEDVKLILSHVNAFWPASVAALSAMEANKKPNKAAPASQAEHSGESTQSRTSLKDISLRMGPGASENAERPINFIQLIGTVGSGKSSLLHLILGELAIDTEGGTEQPEPQKVINGSVAYVPQVPFILNETVRNNILFGRTFNPEWYDRVVFACALERDFAELPGGDLTLIGERGINISGGQKMRVALARAVYANAQIYLIDDALAAVDVHVGKHIFDHVYMGLLASKPRLIAMHQLQYLQHADQVCCMGVKAQEGGRVCHIAACGTFKELMKESPPEFAQLVSNSEAVEAAAAALDTPASAASSDSTVDVDKSHATASDYDGNSADSASADKVTATAQSTNNVAADGAPRTDSDVDGTDPSNGKDPSASEAADAADAAPSTAAEKPEPSVGAAGDIDRSSGKLQDIAYDSVAVANGHRRGGVKAQGSKGDADSDADGDVTTENSKKSPSSPELSEEVRITGTVEIANWALYGRSMGFGWFVVMLFTYVLSRGVMLSMDFWIRDWTAAFDTNTTNTTLNSSLSTESVVLPELEELGWDQNTRYLLVYGVLGVAATVASGLRSMAWVVASWKGAKKLYADMIPAIMNSTMRFFDITPTGRILNRVAHDTQQVDEQLPEFMRDTLDNLFLLLGSIVAICIVIPWMLLPVVPLAIGYFFLYRLYSAAARELKRVESIARSPVFNHFSQTLQGLPSIWAFRNSGLWTAINDFRVDDHFRAQFVSYTAKRWLNQRLDFIGTTVVTLVTFYAAAFPTALGAADSGLAITYSLQVARAMQMFVYFAAEMELSMNAVERVSEYQQLKPEAAHSQEEYILDVLAEEEMAADASKAQASSAATSTEMVELGSKNGDVDETAAIRAKMHKRQRRKPTQLMKTGAGRQKVSAAIVESEDSLKNWPSNGAIEISNFTMRYAPHLDDVLRGLSVSIPAQCKVGICGRTGSGKSSLALALFRLVECRDGSISIDGVNIADMGLQTLRSRIGMVPQEPTLFRGTLRFNLDPWHEFDDAAIWGALEKVQMSKAVSAQSGGLDCAVDAGGKNWSVGQRQLICVARALLHRVKILVMDEASASIDAETDFLLQQMIRTEFRSCTVLTIAHRLDTLEHSDLVLVLDHGTVAFFGPPDDSSNLQSYLPK